MVYRKGISFETRFWEKVIKTEGCWKWVATKHKGYGMIRPGGLAPKIAASRASWLIHFGEIPFDMHVLHKCDNPECTNPEHLFLGTHRDNMLDKETKGRARPDGWLDKTKVAALKRRRLGPIKEAEVRNLYTLGASVRGLARMFSVDRNVIKRIVSYP